MRQTLHVIWVMFKWHVGVKGKPCKCSFFEASHYNIDLEFDMDNYPCHRFIPREPNGRCAGLIGAATKGSEVERVVRHHYCSFCGGRGDEVPLLIGGPAVMICSNCVAKCVKVLVQQNIILPVAQRQWVEGSDDSNLGWWDFEEIDEATPLHAGAEALYLVSNV